MSHTLSVRILPLSLEGLDGLDGEDLVAFASPEDRPLRGLAGLVDWRACGRLTRLIKDGHFSGEAGEALIVLPAGSVRVRRVFLLGGATTLETALERVRRAGGDRAAVAFAGGPIETALRAVHGAGLSDVTLLASDVRAADHALDAARRALPWLRRAVPSNDTDVQKSA